MTRSDRSGPACEEYREGRQVRLVLNNAFAFGGLNSALVLRAWEP